MIQPYYQSIQGKIQRKKHDFPLFSAHSRIKLLQNLDELLAQQFSVRWRAGAQENKNNNNKINSTIPSPTEMFGELLESCWLSQ